MDGMGDNSPGLNRRNLDLLVWIDQRLGLVNPYKMRLNLQLMGL